MNALFRVLGTVTIALATAIPARAETILLTSGALDWVKGSPVSVTMSGDGFSFTGQSSPSSGIFTPFEQCAFPFCAGGTSLNLSTRFTGGSIGGTATYDGTTYSPVGSLTASASLDARWDGGLTIPAEFTGGVLTAPFQFAGEFYYDPPNTSSSVLDLLGSGRATVSFAPSLFFPGTFNVTAVRYEFDGASPVPEPTSMLLIGTGLTGVAALRRRRRKKARLKTDS